MLSPNYLWDFLFLSYPSTHMHKKVKLSIKQQDCGEKAGDSTESAECQCEASLVNECKELQECRARGVAYTEMLGRKCDMERRLKDEIKRVDHELLLKRCSLHS